MSGVILEIDQLTKRYGDRLAVDHLSLQVNKGDIYGFLGHNGAGKSTTIRMIMGMVWPTSGDIRVNGHSVVPGRHKYHWPVGAIIESPVFYEYLSARTNLEILSALSGGASKERIDEIVKMVRLTDRQHEKVSVYSHGMRQRLGLAQALLPQPELIILDEPLDGLDPKGIRDLRDVMLHVARDLGVTIFLSSHILSEVELTCNRVAVIHAGRRIYEGTTDALISRSDLVLLRTANGRDPAEMIRKMEFVQSIAARDEGGWMVRMDHGKVPELNRQLVGAGFDVMELSPKKNRLEDVFLELTGMEQARLGHGEAIG
ncbi:ABC transporter ATP-binding protein [Candidatus Sumerlaeota bacterium]|nr:ABC transporter ATP-binding protein [Candidatus Sumerlaeota bacterium]